MSKRAPAKSGELGWRRKPQMRFEGIETSGAGFAQQPTPRWHLWGPHAKEDFHRIMRAEVCVNCCQPFPERPSAQSAQRIIDEMRPFGRPDHEVRKMLCASHCPFCGAEVSPEMARAFFEGFVQRTHEAATVEPGEHGNYEGLIERGSDSNLYLPPGWDK